MTTFKRGLELCRSSDECSTFHLADHSPITRVLITGTAGFIGLHLAKQLLGEDFTFHGSAYMTYYYDVCPGSNVKRMCSLI